jgi:hypothetical protein
VGIVQRFLCLQLFIPIGAPCSFELGVTDGGGNRRRMFISSAFKAVGRDPLHAKVQAGHALALF